MGGGCPKTCHDSGVWVGGLGGGLVGVLGDAGLCVCFGIVHEKFSKIFFLKSFRKWYHCIPLYSLMKEDHFMSSDVFAKSAAF